MARAPLPFAVKLTVGDHLVAAGSTEGLIVLDKATLKPEAKAKMDDLAKAKATWQEGLSLFPDSAQIKARLATLLAEPSTRLRSREISAAGAVAARALAPSASDPDSASLSA